jgi:hypothetical protein
MAARSLSEIYKQIIDEKANYAELSALQPNINSQQTLLNELTSTSKVAVWRLICWIVAFSIYVHEKLIDEQTAELEARAESIIPGTLRWYRNMALEWQKGDKLEWDYVLTRYRYNPVNPSNRVVAYSAAVEANNQIVLKVAKKSGNNAAPLTAQELTQFTDYITLRKFAGTNVTIISAAPDDVKITATIYIDKLVLKTNGESILNAGVFPVEDSIKEYLRDIGTVNFNGKMRALDLIDAIQATQGVVNVVLTHLEAKYGTLPYTNVLTAPGQEYQSNAGHLAINTLTLNYV